MSGANIVPNIALGKAAYYAGLPAANDAIVVVLLKSASLPSDATIKDCADLGAILTAGAVECDATNYSRKILTTGVTVTVDNANDRTDIDTADLVWTALGGATNNTLGKIVFCYDPDTTVGGAHNANLIPLMAGTFDVTTDGTDLTAAVANFLRIT